MTNITPPVGPNYDESEAGDYTLPDPLTFRDGTPVRTADDWTRRRRELLPLFEASIYGRSPQPPRSQDVQYEVFDTDDAALGGKAIRRQITISFSPDKQGPKEDVLIYLPAGVRKPVPLFLALNFGGNQSVNKDAHIRLGTVWDPKTHERRTASEESRGQDIGFDVEKILARGYGFATICYQDIEPDFDCGWRYGIRPLFFQPGQAEPLPEDWGAIGAWAYGASRVMDYLEQAEDIDAQHVALLGHSRLGKTALWAGAQDERFAMVIANCSGAGGAALARRRYGETVRNLVDRFPYWFCGNLKQYADHTDRLPVDMHELIALSAPRPVYVTGAEEDRWADPKGEFLACVAAGPVYRLLGAQDLGAETMPPLDQAVHATIAFHCRSGGHAVTSFDWDQFLAFTDKKFDHTHKTAQRNAGEL